MTNQPTEGLLNEILAQCPDIPLTLWNRLCRRVSELEVQNEKLEQQVADLKFDIRMNSGY